MSFVQKFYERLNGCAFHQSDENFNFLNKIIREEDESRAIRPAMACLLFWGEKGVREIHDICLKAPRLKIITSAISLLFYLSKDFNASNASQFVEDKNLAGMLSTSVHDSSLSVSGDRYLSELILNLDEDDLIFSIGQVFMRIGLTDPSIFQTFMQALSARWLGFGSQVFCEYRRLLIEESDNEDAFHSFFEQHPTFLDPLAVQVWSKPNLHGVLEPDFIVRRGDDSYLVVEIEKPSKKIMTKTGQVSALTTQAERQVIDYKGFILRRLSELNNHFPNISEPDCLVVIGLESDLSEEQKNTLRSVNQSKIRTQIVGFDGLLARAETLVKNVTQHRNKVFQRHRVY